MIRIESSIQYYLHEQTLNKVFRHKSTVFLGQQQRRNAHAIESRNPAIFSWFGTLISLLLSKSIFLLIYVIFLCNLVLPENAAEFPKPCRRICHFLPRKNDSPDHNNKLNTTTTIIIPRSLEWLKWPYCWHPLIIRNPIHGLDYCFTKVQRWAAYLRQVSY